MRAANEVMQATGVVEDAKTALIKVKKATTEKHKETFTGLRLMEVGRAALVGGVWGVLGLRRRILVSIRIHVSRTILTIYSYIDLMATFCSSKFSSKRRPSLDYYT